MFARSTRSAFAPELCAVTRAFNLSRGSGLRGLVALHHHGVRDRRRDAGAAELAVRVRHGLAIGHRMQAALEDGHHDEAYPRHRTHSTRGEKNVFRHCLKTRWISYE